MIRTSQTLRMTSRLLVAILFTLVCLHTSAAINDEKAKRSRFAGTDGEVFGFFDPDEECHELYGMPEQENCDSAIDGIPFGLVRFEDNPASVANTEFLDRIAERRYLSLPYVRFPQTWTVESCSVTVMMQQPRDNATWANIVTSGRNLVDACVLGRGIGGVQLTGENNNVALYLYHPTSKFQEYMDAISMMEMVYDPEEDCSDVEDCHQGGHKSGSAHGQQTPCSSGYSLGPANCCSNHQFSWSSISGAAVGLILGTKQFFPNGIYGWCNLLAESSLNSRAYGVTKYEQKENASPALSTANYMIRNGLVKTNEALIAEDKSPLRHTTSKDAESLQQPNIDIRSQDSRRDKRSRIAQPGDRSPNNGRFGLAENPPQCGLEYGNPLPRDCVAAFNEIFPEFPQRMDSTESLGVRQFVRWGFGAPSTSRNGVAGFTLPGRGLVAAFGNCVMEVQLRDDANPPVHATSELAAWYDIATSLIDVISVCAEGQGLGGRQDTGQDNNLSVRVYGPSKQHSGPSTTEFDAVKTWCSTFKHFPDGSVCTSGEVFTSALIPSGTQNNRPFSPYTGRTCSTGYASLAVDCCDAFVFVAQELTIAVARLIMGTIIEIVKYGYCTFITDTMGS